ncbi:MAG: hypothetical protein ABSE56_11470 [Bryobacteraceae bacterium]
MKIAAVLLSGFFALASSASAQLANVHSVYLLPMGGGLDQHLANRITGAGLFQVVTDPKKADAVFTDRLGEGLETRLSELYPAPEPPKPQPEAPKAKPAAGKTDEEAKPEPEAEAKPKETPVLRPSAFGSGKGTIFLVDPRSHVVLWSFYEKPKNTSSPELDRTAGHIVERLRRVLKGK